MGGSRCNGRQQVQWAAAAAARAADGWNLEEPHRDECLQAICATNLSNVYCVFLEKI
jgi:hypothetical protein